VFGNEDEAMNFAKEILGFESTDIPAIALKISNMPSLSATRKRLVVITQGGNPVVYAQDNEVKQVEVKPIPADQIVDTNGAGDSFVGGFLSQFVQNKSLEKCIDCGNYVSSLVIRRSGCTFPGEMLYE